jgi:MFS family permease
MAIGLMAGSKIITRTIWIVSLISLFTDIASEMLYPVMPIFLRKIGFTVALIGILEGMAEATAGISKGYFGNMSDRIGKRVPFIRTGYGLSAFSKPMMGLLIAPAWIFMSRALDRIGKGVRTGARDALLSAEATPGNKGRVFGFHRGMDTLGAAIGPLIALLFLFWFPEQYRWLFILAFCPGVMAVSLSFLLKENRTPDLPAQKVRTPFFGFVSYWKKAPVDYKYLVAGLLAFTLFNSSDVFLLLLLKEKGFGDTALIGMYVFYNIVYALMSYPLGALADKIGLKIVLISGLILFAVVYGSIGFVDAFAIIVVVFFLYGIYAAAVEGISKALISNIVLGSDTATAIGFYTGFASLATFAASGMAGFLWTAYSPKVMFVFSAAGVICVVIYLSFVFWQRKVLHKIRP